MEGGEPESGCGRVVLHLSSIIICHVPFTHSFICVSVGGRICGREREEEADRFSFDAASPSLFRVYGQSDERRNCGCSLYDGTLWTDPASRYDILPVR